MPARLMMVNPGKPRKRKKAAAKKKPSAAQLRARKKFAAMAKSGGFKKKKATKKAPAKKRAAKKAPARKKSPVRKKAKKKAASRTRTNPRKAVKEKKVAAKKRTKKRGTKRKAAKRSPKRRTASKRRTRRNPSTARKRRSTTKRRTRRNPSKRSAAAKKGWATRTRRQLKSSRAAAKRAPKKSVRRAVQRARSGALSIKKRALTGGLSPSAKKMARQYGLLKVNPKSGFTAFLKDAASLLPAVGVGIGGAVAIGMGGGWAKKKAQEWAKQQDDPAKAAESAMVKYAAPLATGTLSAVAYAALRMGKKTSKFSGFVLASGWTLTALQILSLIMVKEKDEAGVETGNEVSLGSKMGLPIGGYVAIGAPNPNLLVDGTDIRLNGAHYDDVGAYVADPGIGEYVSMGGAGVFDGSSLGAAQMGYGREGQRARGDEPTAAEILEEGDAEGGVLSGSVFDD